MADISRLGDQGRLGQLFVGPRDAPNPLSESEDLLEVRRTMEHVAERVWDVFAGDECHHDGVASM